MINGINIYKNFNDINVLNGIDISIAHVKHPYLLKDHDLTFQLYLKFKKQV